MKNKGVSAAVILLVFFSTFGIGVAMADHDVNETSDEVTEAVNDTVETEGDVAEDQKEEGKKESNEDITEAEEEVTEAEGEIGEGSTGGVDTAQSEKYSTEAKALLVQARDARDAGEYKKARKHARAAKKMAKQAKRGKAFRKMTLLHRYDVFFHQLERHRIGMEAIIKYVDENGGTSEQLVIIKDNFVALESELETAANSDDESEFKDILKDARKLTKEFREESHNVLETEGMIGDARTKVNEALKENEEYLKSLRIKIQDSRKESELEMIDEANDKIEEQIEKLKEKEENIEELLEKLNEIKGKRSALKEKLEAAIESCDGVGIGVCDTTEAQEYRALKDEIREDYKELRKTSRKAAHARRISNAVRKSHKVLEKLEERIAEAEEEGADVTVLKARLEEVKGMLGSTETKYKENGYEGALEEFKNAKKAFKTTRKDFIEKAKERRKAVKKNIPEERKKDVKEKAKDRREEVKDRAKERREEIKDRVKERREEVKDRARERRNASEDSKTLKDEGQS